MRTLAGLFLASALAAAPQIGKGRVVNAASNIPPGLPFYGLAQGAIFTIYGDGLSGDPQQANYPLPVSLGGTSVQVTVGDTTVDAIMIFVASQLDPHAHSHSRMLFSQDQTTNCFCF